MSIELRHLTKTFGHYTALHDVSLAIPDGELVALLGPSGSGKTTLLRIIAGLEGFDPHGQSAILFHNKDVAQQHVGKRNVGFVFQHYALFRHMTVFENVAFGLRVKRRKERPTRECINQKVKQLLRLIQLEDLGDRFPAQLSGGQRQRVALARALAIEPRILLLDEPFGALDARVRQGLRRWLRKLHDEIRVTSVFVTHDQEEALEVADQIVVMNEGRIEQVGAPEEVFHRPANAFVMDFLGSVNLFHGRIESGKAVFDSLVVDTPAGSHADGESAKLFVRPHELEIHTKHIGKAALQARIERIQSTGPLVKLELLSQTGQAVHVEMSHDRFQQEPLEVGADVFVTPRESRVFVSDYSI
jgi:sulfate/thiosulfate transport system ATP-binding protein